MNISYPKLNYMISTWQEPLFLLNGGTSREMVLHLMIGQENANVISISYPLVIIIVTVVGLPSTAESLAGFW